MEPGGWVPECCARSRSAERSEVMGTIQVYGREGYDLRALNKESAVWTGTRHELKGPHAAGWGAGTLATSGLKDGLLACCLVRRSWRWLLLSARWRRERPSSVLNVSLC